MAPAVPIEKSGRIVNRRGHDISCPYTRKEKKDAALTLRAAQGKRAALRFRKLFIPIREFAIVEKSLGGPLAEVDGEGYAVAGVGACKDQVFVGWMGVEDGDEIFCEKDGAAPAVSDADVLQCGMQGADALFESF